MATLLAEPPSPRGIWRVLSPRRVLITLGACALLGLLVSPIWVIPTIEVMARAMLVGLVALVVFGVFERWPRTLPSWLARWCLQVTAVVAAIPLAVLVLYLAISVGDELPFWKNEGKLSGFITLSVTGLALASWMAMSALLRQRDEEARNQALAFELERSELERKALDARLRLLQAQVEPHFLFNTLANVRELVDSGSPQASKVLDTLITYLRAAVPRLQDPTTTLGQELQLVRAYLELMQLRMDDRLTFAVDADPAAERLRCPPTTLLTLVENAIRHGIDPSEEGGRIDVAVRVREGRVHAEVSDSGMGLGVQGDGLGTGLSSLRERLQLAFGAANVHLDLASGAQRGTRAVVEFPAESVKA
jgi:hypothetical protein